MKDRQMLCAARLRRELAFLNRDHRQDTIQELSELGLAEKDKEDDMILHIQSKFKLTYFSIWNSLEKREKFMLYDIAQNGLANNRNIAIVSNLRKLGILVLQKNRIELFNRSFENFVLTMIDRKESLEFELEAKKTGVWSNIRYPILLVIAAIFLFLFTTQKDLFTDIIGWVAALLAGLPVISRLFMGFTGIRSGKSKSGIAPTGT
jgi:hypothetical protein